jgi:hypothetical protein
MLVAGEVELFKAGIECPTHPSEQGERGHVFREQNVSFISYTNTCGAHPTPFSRGMISHTIFVL